MTINISEKYALALALLFIFRNGVSQDFKNFPDLGTDLDSWYASVATDNIQAPIMKGVHYYKREDQMITPDQNPFFEESWEREGSLTYEGRHYTKQTITYNISDDILLIWSPEMNKGGQKSILIDQSKIDSFRVHQQHFLNHKHVGIGNQGFYKKVMQGSHLKCFSKITKTGNLDGLEYIYEEKSEYWIQYGGKNYSFKNVSSLFKIFPNHKKQIRRYHNEIRSILRGDKERYVQLMLYYCDSIVK